MNSGFACIATRYLILSSCLLLTGVVLAESSRTEISNRLDAAATVLTEIMNTPEKSIPTPILAEAKCIVVVPSLVNVEFGVGGRLGKGVVTCRASNDWSAPAPLSFRGGSLGLQTKLNQPRHTVHRHALIADDVANESRW